MSFDQDPFEEVTLLGADFALLKALQDVIKEAEFSGLLTR